MLKYCRLSFLTNSSGVGSISFQIPGTFGGIDKTQVSYSGRLIKNVNLWFASPISGDCVTSFTVTDTTGVLPTPLQAAIPSYPILATWSDTGIATGDQGLYLYPNSVTNLCPEEGKNNIPSQLYLNIAVQKGSEIIDTFYINIEWDDGV